MNEDEKKSIKNFAYTFSIFFLIIFLYFFLFIQKIYFLFLAFSLIIFLLGIFKPNLLKFPNLIWFKFGTLISKITSPIFLFLIFVLLFIPLGVILQLSGKDLLGKKLSERKTTYWKNKEELSDSMDNQF